MAGGFPFSKRYRRAKSLLKYFCNMEIMQQLIEELKIKLIDILNLQDITPEKFDENAQLVGGELGIDSIDVLEMVVMVEKDYGIVINNQEVGEKVFKSLASLATYIREHSAKASS
jgi:acyl carrier protein